MSVYVDDPIYPYRGSMYCHMIADTHDELEEMARRIGLDKSWIQRSGTYLEHYDLSRTKRRHARSLGARGLSGRELAARLAVRRVSSAIGGK